MVSVCTVPARGGRSCEHFGGYKTINRIPLLYLKRDHCVLDVPFGVKVTASPCCENETFLWSSLK